MRPFVTLLALLTAAPVLAQPAALTVTPDTLYWTWTTGQHSPFEIRNVGADSLRLDTLTVGPCSHWNCQFSGPAYTLELVHAGERYWGMVFSGPLAGWTTWSPDGDFPRVVMAPGDSAQVFVRSIDGCPVCLGGGPNTWAPVLFWGGGNPTPIERTLAYVYPVAAESGAAVTGADLTLAGPNPSAEGAALRLRLDEASEVDLALYDALGRRVRKLLVGALAAGTHAVEVGGGGLSPGLYFARAAVGTRRGAVVVTRRLLLSR